MMNNDEIKNLCISLMKADTEEAVIGLLQTKGFWNEPKYWRYYGDKENNYSAAGNQADEAEAALVEKITNSRDAILMNECLVRGIDPKGQDAPGSVREAVAKFFEDDSNNELAGQVKEWSNEKRRKIANNISVFITGNKPSKDKFPCINIADRGEGQTPLRIPDTILSLGESIKRKIRFVHGKWNMGGTAALVYCGKNNLQLIISKRNQKLIATDEKKATDENWGFTIVRREDPVGTETSSTYKYLAPLNIGTNSNCGDILNFQSDTLPIFTKFNEPYSVDGEWGTLIKLYEYQTKFKQNVQGSGGMLRPLDLLATDLGLPFRLHECRYEGTPGSFEHQVNGIQVRLHDDRGNVLENGYPTSHGLVINGETFSISVYAFKDDKAKNYREGEKGIIFTLNGQAQGWLDDRIFSRNKVGLGFLRNSLLVIVDCSSLSYRAQEELFVNDRVHLRKGDFKDKIEADIIDHLSQHQGLFELQEERKRKLKAEKIDNSKPLESVLSNVFKHSSALSKIFLRGERLSNPFKPVKVKSKDTSYTGNMYPTYFKFKKLDYGSTLERDAYQESKCRIPFETDAQNDYFIRKTNPGTYKLFIKEKNEILVDAKTKKLDYGLNLLNGIATLNIGVDNETQVGDKIHLVLEVSDPMRIAEPPFINEFILDIKPEAENDKSNKSSRIKPPDTESGDDREKAGGISFPEIELIREKDWESHGFNKYSAMKVIKSKGSAGENEVKFTFYINMDNLYLQQEIKDNVDDTNTLEAYFKYGMALLGISVIYDDQQNKPEDKQYEDIEDQIAVFSRAMSPMIIPMIREFGELDLKNELIEQLH